MMPDQRLLRLLASAFTAGEQTFDAIVARVARMLNHDWRWLRPVAREYLKAFEGRARPNQAHVAEFLHSNERFQRACRRHARRLSNIAITLQTPKMCPVSAARDWDVPVIETAGDLARWLGLTVGELDWFADWKGLNRKARDTLLCHYSYRELQKGSGAVRLIEMPKMRLKQLQRKILAEILDRVPGHPASHGFRKHRSILTFASPHTDQDVIVRMDLKDYFPSFVAARVQAFFRTAGYPEAVANALTGLCTTIAPRRFWREAGELYGRRHLPQGAPTSPALASLCTYRVDCRLAGLAEASGAVYTRYADDLAFSGGESFARVADRFSNHVAAILLEEGFRVQHRKTRIMRRGVRHHLAGLVLNQHANARRDDYDRLKAILTNCSRHGTAGQNRDQHPDFRAHLDGRVSFVEMVNPARGARLRAIFNQIGW